MSKITRCQWICRPVDSDGHASAASVSSFEELLDGTGKREQPLLDKHGHLTGITDCFSALRKNARVPIASIGQIVYLALVGICFAHPAQLGNFIASKCHLLT